MRLKVIEPGKAMRLRVVIEPGKAAEVKSCY
jgi:hypothetical protein